MTINNLEVSELASEICRKASLLNFYEREAKEHALFMALSDIELAARKAQEILNALKYPK